MGAGARTSLHVVFDSLVHVKNIYTQRQHEHIENRRIIIIINKLSGNLLNLAAETAKEKCVLKKRGTRRNAEQTLTCLLSWWELRSLLFSVNIKIK